MLSLLEMGTVSQLTAYACCTFSYSNNNKDMKIRMRPTRRFRIHASSDDQSDDCNSEECAPEKEVGKVSMEWVAEERTQVVGTFPPRTRTRGYTGYVEKDTAGQTNIYSVEPAVYIAESAISSGSAGSSADGSENTAAIIAGLALISIAAAASVLLQVGKTPPPSSVVPTLRYSGPPLTYYINKFKPPEIVQAASVTQLGESESESESGVPQLQLESVLPPESLSSSEAPSVN